METALIIEGLPPSLTTVQLHTLFAQYGKVAWAQVPTHHSGRSHGYGYVEMYLETDAKAALKALDGQENEGSRIHVRPLYISPLIVETQRFLDLNPDKAFCDACLLRHVWQLTVMSMATALRLLIHHFPGAEHGRCEDCGEWRLVISARKARPPKLTIISNYRTVG